MLFGMAGTQCVLKSCEWLKGSQATKLLSATYAILTFGGMFMIEVDHLKNSCHYLRDDILPWSSPKVEPEARALVQIVYSEVILGIRRKGWRRVRQGRKKA